MRNTHNRVGLAQSPVRQPRGVVWVIDRVSVYEGRTARQARDQQAEQRLAWTLGDVDHIHAVLTAPACQSDQTGGAAQVVQHRRSAGESPMSPNGTAKVERQQAQVLY